MEKTIDLPNELLQRAEAEALKRGVQLSDLLEEGLERVLSQQRDIATHSKKPQEQTLFDLMRDELGIVDSGVGDLSSNPKHLEGYGSDSIGNC